MKKLIGLLLAGFFVCLPLLMQAGEKATTRTQAVYVIRVSADTMWFWGKTFRQSLLYSELYQGDTTKGITFEGNADTMWIWGGLDTAIVAPTSEAIRLTFVSKLDTISQVWSCNLLRFDTLKVGLLMKYSKFGHTVPDSAESFAYQFTTDSNLVRLRAEFHLDSVAGSGDEFSRQRNLLRWVHKRIRHDGNSTNPSPANADHIIAVCDKEGRGVNCRMLGTTLNEVYLAMGYKSRHLTCLPYDTLDQDCHVIDMVWSTQYNKWLYMDPTFDAYWMNRDRTPMSPWEVRIAIKTGDSIKLSDSTNWNGQLRTYMEYYNYMAKNLFRFMVPAVSSYGYESNSSIVEVALYPSDYRPDLVGKTVPNKSGTAKYQYTDNADWFFAPPK
jgi:hypothetical protein